MNSLWIISLTCLTGLPQEQDKHAPGTAPPQGQESTPAHAARFLQHVGVQQPKPTTLEEAINVALRNHPDIRIAQAKLQVAEAELAQARLIITQKVAAAHAELAAAKADVELASRQIQDARVRHEQGVGSPTVLEQAEHRLQQVRAVLAAKEAAFHVLVGLPTPGAASTVGLPTFTPSNLVRDYLVASVQKVDFHNLNTREDLVRRLALQWVQSAPQPVADRLKAVLDHPISMEKHQGVELEACLRELLKRASLDIKVRVPAMENKEIVSHVTKLNLDAGEFPVRVWLQLILDEANGARALNREMSGQAPARYDLYIREYGLLLSTPELAPPDAIRVQDFWKQVQAEGTAKTKGEKK